MTCIVGIARDGVVYMGGERGASDENVILPMHRPKIVQMNNYLIGYAGSQGIGQLAHMIDLPPIGKNIQKTLRTTFVKTLRNAIEEYGNASTVDDNATEWLIGVDGKLFEISSVDWQVSEYIESAIGSGGPIALGSLHTSRNWKDQERRIRYSLQAAVDISTTCSGPIDILSI